MNNRSWTTLFAAGSVLCQFGITAAAAQTLPLALELDGTRVTLGSTVELVVRTTEARPFTVANLAFEVRDRDGVPAVAFAAIESFALLGGGVDDTIDVTFNPVTQRSTLVMASAAATLNTVMGPLAVVRFSLDPTVQLDDRFEIWVDPDALFLDSLAAPVVTEVGRGDLRIVEEEPGRGLGALGGEAYPGALVVLGAVTDLPFPIGGGTIEIGWDPSLFSADPPLVVIDPRYGSAQIDAVDASTPGHLIVTFSSPGGDLNQVLHGAFFNVVLQSLAGVAVGTASVITLGPATALSEPDGTPIALELGDEGIDFIDPEIIAAAAFEEGGFQEWWVVVQ